MCESLTAAAFYKPFFKQYYVCKYVEISMKEPKLCAYGVNEEESASGEVIMELENRWYKDLAFQFISWHKISYYMLTVQIP